MQRLVWQNANGDEINLTSGNYGITEWEGFSNASLNIQNQQVPFQDGAVFLDALIEPRELSVTLKMQDNGNLEERYRMRRELIHALNPKLGEGYLIYTNDFISKRIKCVPQIPLFPTHNSNDSGTPSASLAWTACEPYWEDLEETVVSISANEEIEIINNGDVPIQLKAEFVIQGEDFLLRNLTNKKKIGIKGYHYLDAFLDTNIGQKKLEKKGFAVNYTNGGIFTSILSVKEKMYLVGTQFITIDIDGNIDTIIINEKTAINDITYSDTLNMFALCGNNYIYTSYDGKKWTKQTIPSQMTAMYLISYEDGIFKARDYRRYITSVDGINWEIVTTTISKEKDKIYRDGIYTKCENNTIKTSSDNSTWTTVYELNVTGLQINIFALCYFWGNYYFVGNYGIVIKTNDLVNFEFVIIPLFSPNILNISCTQTKAFALANFNKFYKSNDANIWEEKNTPIDYNHRILAIDDNNIILTSQDSTHPAYRSIDGGETFNPITVNNGVYRPFFDGENVFLIGNNYIYKSVDFGASWNNLNVSISNADNLITIAKFNGSYFILVWYQQTIKVVKTTDFQSFTTVFSLGGFSNTDEAYFRDYSDFAFSDDLLIFIYKTGFVRTEDGNNWIQKDIVSELQSYDELRSCLITNGVVWLCANSDIFNTINFNNFSKISILYIAYYNYCIAEFKGNLLFGGNTGNNSTLSKYTQIENENIINELSNDSDISFNIDVGKNDIVMNLSNGIAKGSIRYRQKYIGV